MTNFANALRQVSLAAATCLLAGCSFYMEGEQPIGAFSQEDIRRCTTLPELEQALHAKIETTDGGSKIHVRTPLGTTKESMIGHLICIGIADMFTLFAAEVVLTPYECVRNAKHIEVKAAVDKDGRLSDLEVNAGLGLHPFSVKGCTLK